MTLIIQSKTYAGLHMNFQLLLSDLNHSRYVLTNFHACQQPDIMKLTSTFL
jgi:hypothetical protein